MLKKANRIRKDKEFDRAFKLGQSFYSNFLGVKIVDNDLPVSRLGVMVSNKVSKKAPTRNLIKRRIREIFRKNLVGWHKGKDVVAIASPAIIQKSYREIEEFIKNVIKKITS